MEFTDLSADLVEQYQNGDPDYWANIVLSEDTLDQDDELDAWLDEEYNDWFNENDDELEEF